MFVVIAQAMAGLALLYLGGESLVRGASALALRLGVSALAIGLTVVALGTSAPELVVSLDAVLSGANDISVGNVVGSNIANIALILGLSLVIRPSVVQAKIVRIDAPIMLAASFALVAVLADGTASRTEGLVLLSSLIAYVAFTFWESGRESPAVRDEIEAAVPRPGASTALSSLLVLVGMLLLVGGGHLLVTSAVALATALGVSQAIIGLTIVAIGTSLPEFSTTVVASIRGQGDIAIGNVVGSNIFNILGILGVTAVVHPIRLGAITRIDLGVLVGLAGVLFAAIYVRRRLSRSEGVVLLVAFVSYSSWLLAA